MTTRLPTASRCLGGVPEPGSRSTAHHTSARRAVLPHQGAQLLPMGYPASSLSLGLRGLLRQPTQIRLVLLAVRTPHSSPTPTEPASVSLSWQSPATPRTQWIRSSIKMQMTDLGSTHSFCRRNLSDLARVTQGTGFRTKPQTWVL